MIILLFIMPLGVLEGCACVSARNKEDVECGGVKAVLKVCICARVSKLHAWDVFT